MHGVAHGFGHLSRENRERFGAFFGEVMPAATMVLCELAKPEMKIEIEVTALRG